MTTCKVDGVPVKGATCGLIYCTSNECAAPDDHKCIHMDRDQMRNYVLTTRRPDGSRGRIVLQARSLTEATERAGDVEVVASKSTPWDQTQ